MPTIRTKGISFPIILTSGRHTIVEGSDLIKDSIKIILSWPIYTRDYEDAFGSRVFELLEEPNDSILMTLLKRFTTDSLSRWESRIVLESMDFQKTAPEKVSVNLVYRIKEFDIQDTLQYYLYTNQLV